MGNVMTGDQHGQFYMAYTSLPKEMKMVILTDVASETPFAGFLCNF